MKVRLDTGGLCDRLAAHERQIAVARNAVDRHRLPRLEVSYDDLIAQRDVTLARVVGFLGVEPDVRGLDSSFVPIDDVPHDHVIENVEDLHAVLVGTRFAWMLESRRARLAATPHSAT